ncbi:MAG: hypothetical protein IJG37_01440, partial [Synergistaceae bacterium]|nr:hypothetical protein [Synergistaceae bacterium]
ADSPAETQPPSAYRSITAQYREGMTRGEAVRAVVEAMASLPDTEAAEHGVEKLIPDTDSQDAQ